jgi:hypothetical protein
VATAEPVRFELERMAADDGVLEVAGRWTGVRGRRFMRPSLAAVGAPARALASLEHKPWAPDEGSHWIATFPWPGAVAEIEALELVVAPDLAVVLPAPSTDAGDVRELTLEARSPEPGEKPASVRDQALESRDQALESRDQALESRDQAVEERGHALRAREEAILAREEAVQACEEAARVREEAVRARDQAMRERDEFHVRHAELQTALELVGAELVQAVLAREEAMVMLASAQPERSRLEPVRVDGARPERTGDGPNGARPDPAPVEGVRPDRASAARSAAAAAARNRLSQVNVYSTGDAQLWHVRILTIAALTAIVVDLLIIVGTK